MSTDPSGTQTVHQPFENNKKHRLGHRAFTMFLFRRIRFFIFLLALSFGIWYAVRWLPNEYAIWGPFATKLAFVLAAAYFVFIFLETYLEYRYYTYLFTEEAFMMTSGYMLRTEIAALYHQIQNVNIQRGVLDRMIGVSRIVILMVGDKASAQNQIALPGVGKTKAKLVQRELLTRARKHFSQSE
jgi:membrane protein YdbS with pleckstrin-like domain